MPWIMEVLTDGEWKAVHPSGGEPYTYKTKEEAANMLRTCYPEQVRDWRLGGEPRARIRETYA